MSEDAPSSLNAASIISLIERGAYPREAVLTIARGFLPLTQDELITVLAYLATIPDAEISTAAKASLLDIPSRIVVAHAANDAISAVDLVRLLEATTDIAILEALIRNRNVPDDAIVRLARRAEAGVQEVIVINQTRILRAPEILDALLENPALSADARRRALEVREEFFDKRARQAEVEALLRDLPDIPLDDIADLLEEAEAIDTTGAPPPPPDLTELEQQDPEKVSVYSQILKMTIGQRVMLAFRGDKTVRSILVRERARIVCAAAIRNPRMTDSEAEAIAGLRSVDEEVLRLITRKREWMSKYPIVLALCRNPKAPVGVVLPLINRLTLRDLKGLKDDKNVSETVRSTARRLFQTRAKT